MDKSLNTVLKLFHDPGCLPGERWNTLSRSSGGSLKNKPWTKPCLYRQNDFHILQQDLYPSGSSLSSSGLKYIGFHSSGFNHVNIINNTYIYIVHGVRQSKKTIYVFMPFPAPLLYKNSLIFSLLQFSFKKNKNTKQNTVGLTLEISLLISTFHCYAENPDLILTLSFWS